MAAFIPGLGPIELLIILVIIIINVGIPIALVTYLVRKQRVPTVAPPAPGVETKRCATCDSIYDAQYDACPYCARRAPDNSVRWAAQNLSEARYWSLLLGTVWVFLYPMGWVVMMANSSFLSSSRISGVDPLLWLQGFTALVSIALLIAYVVVVVSNPIRTELKVVWVVALLIGTSFTMPFAFYFLVHRPWRAAGAVTYGEPALRAERSEIE